MSLEKKNKNKKSAGSVNFGPEMQVGENEWFRNLFRKGNAQLYLFTINVRCRIRWRDEREISSS